MFKISLLTAAVATAKLNAPSSQSIEFEAWAKTYGRRYSTKEEASFRKGIFAANKAQIDAHNKLFAAGEETFTMGVNPFTDLTHAEFLSRYVGGKKSSKTKALTPAEAGVPALDMSIAPPASVDWVTAGAVTPVKDQGQCGSCWAFATTVATEGSTWKNSSKLISLSEEQIVSCDKANGNDGCNGGDQLPALQWLMKQPGQCSEAGYPYSSGGGKTGKCITGCAPAVKITAAIEVPPKDETALLTAIALQPISLSVDASASFWQSYASGVVTRKCTCTSDQCLDHGVGGVGYGTDGANDFWKIKNSWSASWGENGYIRLARGPAYGVTGQCGVQIDNQYSMSYPL